MTTRKIPDLSKARVLISNDDGINAPGLKVLERAIRPLAKEVIVVAPEHENSGAGHALTLQRPLRIRKISKNRYAIDGTPTDCVLLAINEIFDEVRPDLVVSGVNRGGNLGDDVTYSGTVAVAMEATILGAPAVAFSLDFADGDKIHWPTAEHWIPKILKKLKGVEVPKSTLFNVNFPNLLPRDIKGTVVARQGARKLGDVILEGADPRGRPYYWIGWQKQESLYNTGTDLQAVEDGNIAITPLSIDLTDRAMMKKLKEVFK